MASLARTGNTIKYLGAFLRMGILKKFRRADMSNFSQPPGSQALCAAFYLTGRWVGRLSGTPLVFFCLLLKNYSIYHASYFWSPQKTFQDICCEKMKKKSIFKYVENRLTKRVYFPKKVLRISLYFDRFCWFRFFKHRFANLTKTTRDFFLLVSNS